MTRILVIEDNEQVRKMLGMMLEQEGYEVVEAPEGKTGIDLFHKNPADLVITDIVMPEKEGLETIIELRRDYPDVKVIAISGSGQGSSDTYLNSAKIVGADLAFTKPIARQKLLAAIQEILN